MLHCDAELLAAHWYCSCCYINAHACEQAISHSTLLPYDSSTAVMASSLAHLSFDMLEPRSGSFQLAECKSGSELTTPIHSKWVINASRITIDCKPDGSLWNLGAGESHRFCCLTLLSCPKSTRHQLPADISSIPCSWCSMLLHLISRLSF